MARTLEPQKPMSSDAEMYSAEAFRLSREVQQNTRVELDVAYGPDEEQGLDIYLPALESSAPLPTLLFMHGGGWANGYKEWMGFMAPAITCLPAIFVSVGYRLVPRAQFPDQPNDCWDALKWVYENIERCGGDPGRLFVGGHSSGGHLAALLTLQPHAAVKKGLPEDVIKGCFPISGVFDLPSGNPVSVGGFLRSPDEAIIASPTHYVKGNRTPFFITVGENDHPFIRHHCDLMAPALEREVGPVKVMDVKGADHYEVHLQGGEIDGKWATTVRRWMADPPKPEG
jgi:acetyl esterase/lipase